ncbi:hypothetical protein F511_18069 [Dorcoceras hygrometricum]|uniref:Retrotransposon Copia-like N-terminal domain-containing protein n=1 Tax=Dorcoceras hygrometricum TaxID=472368 RepID=A0A2Z7CCE1_9LAMI|nr:hypothetical protein F511_18069 [Dorcoceras hygrometricum]
MANGKEQESGGGSESGARNTLLYYLHPSDNHGTIISHVQLKGENYEEWARSMRNALRAKKKLGFIDGSLEKPSNDSSEIEDCLMVNSMLVRGSSATILLGNGPRVHQLKTDIAACKQLGQEMMTYYGRLKMMWDELANYEPIPACRCGHCTCNISVEIERIREEERIHQFLMGFDDVMYGTLSTNLLSMEPLPNLNRVYSTVIQEERHRNIARSKEGHGDVVGFTAQAVLGAKDAIVRAKDNKNGICRSWWTPWA